MTGEQNKFWANPEWIKKRKEIFKRETYRSSISTYTKRKRIGVAQLGHCPKVKRKIGD